MAEEYSALDILVTKFDIISHINGVRVSLIDLAASVSIKESVFENTMGCVITMSDGVELTETLPIIGGETIELTYRTDSESPKLDLKFIVTNISNKIRLSDNSNNYVLECASEELLASETQLLSKSFKNKKISNIVRTSFNLLESEKNISIADTKNIHHFISPSWSPFKVINWCSAVAKDVTYESASFSFYENSEGFHFKTLESLLDQEPVADLEYRIRNLATETESSKVAINEYRISNVNDITGLIIDGVTGNTTVSFDPVTKKHKRELLSYDDMMDSLKVPGNSNFQNSSFKFLGTGSRLNVVPTKSLRRDSQYVRQSGSDDFSSFPEVAVKTRDPFISMLSEGIVIQVSIDGDTNIKAGDTLNVEIPLFSGLEGMTGKSSKTLSGRYLVMECIHSIEWSRGYEMSLTLSKIRFENEPEGDIDV